ncbi:MAG: polynucleotide kinase [Halobacteriovoraceae bacterium]|nr:polynucleotide kinase [Halobacteriovoraceae bacterium]MBT5094532.1 polynucleotide kinase [Halobacteriovoraceae bacterium]
MTRKKALLVDLDGTLADVEHRVHHVQGESKDWKQFNEKMGLDALNTWCREIIISFQERGYGVVFLTGRTEDYRGTSEEWLDSHDITYDKLFMRQRGDHRDDWDIKQGIYLEEIKPDFDILFVLEDRLNVVKMWRETGLVCLQCDWGDF